MTHTEKKNEPLNSSTLAAMKEAKDMQKNPSKYESFKNVEELMSNLKEDK